MNQSSSGPSDAVERAWEALGLSPRDREVYAALVDESSSAAELAARTGISQSRVRATLSRLRDAGMAVLDEHGSRRVVAAGPEHALGRLVADVQAGLAHVTATAGEWQRRQDAARATSGAAQLVEVVTGQERIQARFAELMDGATAEVMAFVSPPFLAPGNYEEAERDQLTEGVRYRIVYDDGGVAAQGGAAYLLQSVLAGEEARVTDHLPVKMFLVDRSSAMVPLDLAGAPAAVLVKRFGLVDALVALFELVWAGAWPLADYEGGTAGPNLSPRDQRILGLMRSGLTDEAIARQVGVTVRTVARRVAHMMELTGARTRFQLGWRMAEPGSPATHL